MNGVTMCGRFILILEPGDFEDEIDLGGIPESYLPRYNRMINARAESLAEKPSFRNALKLRRNLILASGFFEWKPVSMLANPKGKSKIPVFIHMKDHKPFVFAGLWEEWRSPDGELVRTTTIITTSSNALIEPFHDRMPVILDGDKRWQWLDASTSQAEALKLLQTYPAEAMTYYPVSTIVNNPAYDNPVCIEEVVE
jgi:putative SOS response-associated peptidase YedK